MSLPADNKDLAALLRRRQAVLDTLAVVERKVARTGRSITRLRRRIAALVRSGQTAA
jgi:hypothetical protein